MHLLNAPAGVEGVPQGYPSVQLDYQARHILRAFLPVESIYWPAHKHFTGGGTELTIRSQEGGCDRLKGLVRESSAPRSSSTRSGMCCSIWASACCPRLPPGIGSLPHWRLRAISRSHAGTPDAIWGMVCGGLCTLVIANPDQHEQRNPF